MKLMVALLLSLFSISALAAGVRPSNDYAKIGYPCGYNGSTKSTSSGELLACLNNFWSYPKAPQVGIGGTCSPNGAMGYDPSQKMFAVCSSGSWSALKPPSTPTTQAQWLSQLNNKHTGWYGLRSGRYSYSTMFQVINGHLYKRTSFSGWSPVSLGGSNPSIAVGSNGVSYFAQGCSHIPHGSGCSHWTESYLMPWLN